LDDTVADPDTDEEHQLPAITARAITMRGPWGPVYGPLDLEVQQGGVTALIGPAGPGRTAVLMTLAGRMKPVAGSLEVLGRTRATAIFEHSALAGIEELDAVNESVMVRDIVTEQLRWNAPWYRLIRRADGADLARVCAPVFGPLAPPDLDAYVDQLTELDALLLRIALVNTDTPPLLVVGSLDQVDEDGARAELVRRLVELGERQTVVTASANPVPDGLGVRAQVPLVNISHAELSTRDQKGAD
jgi:ABC-type dipeptide/oligopeptide/nickel transport system ATPase subunit